MNAENLHKIYSRHGLSNLAKSVDALAGVEDILLDLFNQDKSDQDHFFDSITEIIKRFKRGATI